MFYIMYKVIIGHDSNIMIYNDISKIIDNTFITYNDANNWVNHYFKDSKYIKINIIKI